MTGSTLSAIKLETANLEVCETFFRTIFGFEVTHRYGGNPGDPMTEIVMTLRGEPGTMLKFVQSGDNPADATGATIQIVLGNVAGAIDQAVAAGAALVMPATDYAEAGVRMAVIAAPSGPQIELVEPL